MYQHHIMLKTAQPLSTEDAFSWYKTVQEYGPEDIVHTYVFNESTVALEYGICDDSDTPHAYVVPLKRDLISSEAMFMVQVWEHKFEGDFDIEISNSYDMMPADSADNIIDIDEEVRTSVTQDMNKWEHNRWVDRKLHEGWRWGAYFNSNEKTHPALRQWDDLPESHRKSRTIEDRDIVEWLNKSKLI